MKIFIPKLLLVNKCEQFIHRIYLTKVKILQFYYSVTHLVQLLQQTEEVRKKSYNAALFFFHRFKNTGEQTVLTGESQLWNEHWKRARNDFQSWVEERFSGARKSVVFCCLGSLSLKVYLNCRPNDS